MSAEQQKIHLIIDRLGLAGSTSPASNASPRVDRLPEVLAVPSQPAWLVTPAGEQPKLVNPRPAAGQACAIIEHVTVGRRASLFLQRVGHWRVRINGLPAPLFAVLKERDYFQVGAGFAFYVTVFNQPTLGKVSPDLVGRECPVCRVPFEVGVKCYVCPCGAVLHFEEEDKEDSLQCAQLRIRSGCPACQRPLILEAGYTFLPEANDE